MAHDYTIELRFSGKNLNPHEITKVINLRPSAISTGDESLAGRIREPFWGYNGHDSPQFKEEWSDIEIGFSVLFDILKDKVDVIRSLSQECQAIWWCGHFQDSFDGGPTFSVETLQNLNHFGVPLFLDCYFREGNT